MTRGSFIVFEGGEGSGKSVQVELLASKLKAVATREPGGTPFGEVMRHAVLSPDAPQAHARAEALAIAAARAQHVADVIRPAIDRGQHVVCDRFVHSSLAYQGAGRRLGELGVTAINSFAIDGVLPDAVVLLSVSPEAAASRRSQRGTDDRFEREQSEFHATVNSAFERYASGDDPFGCNWIVVRSDGTPEEVHTLVCKLLRDSLGLEIPE
jgi:dTMP kinase